MNSEKLNIKDIVSAFLQQFDEIVFAYLFGSFISSNNYHDIDIAVYLEDEFNKIILLSILTVMKVK